MGGGTRTRYEIGATATIGTEQYIYTGTVPCFATDDEIQTGSVAGFQKVVGQIATMPGTLPFSGIAATGAAVSKTIQNLSAALWGTDGNAPDVDVNTDSGKVRLRVRGAHIELSPADAQALILSLIEATNQTQRAAATDDPLPVPEPQEATDARIESSHDGTGYRWMNAAKAGDQVYVKLHTGEVRLGDGY